MRSVRMLGIHAVSELVVNIPEQGCPFYLLPSKNGSRPLHRDFRCGIGALGCYHHDARGQAFFLETADYRTSKMGTQSQSLHLQAESPSGSLADAGSVLGPVKSPQPQRKHNRGERSAPIRTEGCESPFGWWLGFFAFLSFLFTTG